MFSSAFLFKLTFLISLFALIKTYKYDIVLNVIGNSSLIEKAINAFQENFVSKSGLKHITNINFIFANLTDNQIERTNLNLCSELFKNTKKVDLILQNIADLDNKVSGIIRTLSKKSKLPMICLKKDRIKEWESLTLDQYNTLIHFKPIENILSTVARDLIQKDNLQTAALLMDSLFGNQILGIVKELSFVKIETIINCQDLSSDDWNVKLKSFKRMAIENYFIFAQTFTINKFLDAFNQQSMFTKRNKVYIITLGNDKIKCESCKHSTFHIIRPIISKLHNYESKENLFLQYNKHRLQLYFYYDLFRLVTITIDRYLKLMKEINSINKLPTLDKKTCENYLNNNQFYDKNDFDDDFIEKDITVFNFRKLLSEQTRNVYGLYGDFVLSDDSIDYGYQDVSMRFDQESYLKETITKETYAEWSFDPKGGNIFFNDHLLENERSDEYVNKFEGDYDSKLNENDELKEGSDKEQEKSEGDKMKNDETKEDQENSESDEAGKPKDNRITIYLIEHPPFIMKRVVDRSKEIAKTTTTTTSTTEKPQTDDEESREEIEDEPEEEENKIQFEYYGFLIDLFELIKKELDAKKTPFPEYKFEEIEVSKDSDKMFYGGDRKTEWSGMIRKINETENDAFALAPLAITASREFLIEFSEPIFQNIGIAILMKKPRHKPHFFKFITVLESKVWVCIIGAYFFTSILLAIFNKFDPQNRDKVKDAEIKNQLAEKNEEQDEYDELTSNRIFTLKESLWFCITSLTPQGGGEAPRSLYGRLVAATWWLFGFIVIASYTANLAAFLTVSRLETKIDDLKKLSKQYKVRYAPIDDTATDFYFMQNAEIEEKFYEIWKDMSLNDSLSENDRAKLAVWDYPVSDRYTKIAAQMGESDKPKGITNALKRVRDSIDHSDGFAILADSLTIEYFSYLFCDVYKVGEDFSPRPIAFGAKKTNSFDIMKLINPIIREIEIEGYIDDLKAKYWENNKDRKQCKEFRKLSNGISLENSGGIFIVILTGIIVTLFALVLENFIIIQMKAQRAKKQMAPIHSPSLVNSDSRIDTNIGCFNSKIKKFIC